MLTGTGGLRIAVVGGLNMDLVVQVPHLPVPGETVAGGPFRQVPGGKGANQAVAAARLGARTSMIGCVGEDAFGEELLQRLGAEGVGTEAVRRVGPTSGVALIVVDAAGQNSIAVASGANALLRPEHVAPEALAQAEVVVTQLESPLDTVEYSLRTARAAGAATVLNAAPAGPVPAALLAAADVLVVNEVEAAMLLGASELRPGDEAQAARQLRASSDQVVVVTLGERGALALAGDQVLNQPTWPVKVVDTTAAGDAFVAAFAVAYWPSRRLDLALRAACAAGALATTKPGAQPSLPRAEDVEKLVGARFLPKGGTR